MIVGSVAGSTAGAGLVVAQAARTSVMARSVSARFMLSSLRKRAATAVLSCGSENAHGSARFRGQAVLFRGQGLRRPLNRLEHLRRKCAHLEVLRLELLDLKTIQSG